MTQIEFYLPPPITAADAASILGRIGGQARAARQREPFKAKARVLREECGLPASEVLSAIREAERT